MKIVLIKKKSAQKRALFFIVKKQFWKIFIFEVVISEEKARKIFY